MNFTFVERFKVDGADPDRLTDLCDHIMEALVDLDGVADPLISGAMATGDVEIGVMVPADEAVEKGMDVIRVAINEAETATPGWPRLDESAVRSIEAEVVDMQVPT